MFIIHGDVHTVTVRDFAECACNFLCCLHHASEGFRVAVKDVHEVYLRYDERVALVHRLDVEKRKGMVVLVDDVCRNFSSEYFIENIIHTGPLCHMC